MSISRQFRTIADRDGLLPAMRWLNAQTPYRFTAIFSFDGDMLRNVCLVDKQNPEVTRCDDQPILNSYCVYIHRTSEKFYLEESLQDNRVVGHPKREDYRGYYGIPLFDRDNRMVGTACHFDTEPIEVTESVVSGLDEVGDFIADIAFAGAGHRS